MISSANFEQIGSFEIVKCYVVEDLTVFRVGYQHQ